MNNGEETSTQPADSVGSDQIALTTDMQVPRQRIFLPQTMRERFMGFWWSVARLLLFRTSPVPLFRWRVLLLRCFGAKVDWSTKLWPSVRIDFPWNLETGPHVVVCHSVILNCMGPVTIGRNTRISQYSHVCAGTHAYQRRDMKIERRPIAIGSDVWIAADAFVGPGVTIGDECVLAARSSAFHDLPKGQICVGEPARVLRPRESLADRG